MANPVVVEIWRGSVVESRHRGAVAVVDSRGSLVAGWGDIVQPVFPRSAVKPLQAIPLVESGAADRFGLSQRELALACASHAGEPAHVTAVATWLGRLGLSETDLVCGPHLPPQDAAARALLAAGLAPSRLHNNCSGKHAGFLTLALDLGGPTAGYGQASHRVQQLARRAIAETGGADADAGTLAGDGCGVPTMALPLTALARSFAVLADPSDQPLQRARAIRRITAAMIAEPWFVAGSGRFDTRLMEDGQGAVIVKSGAEGVCAAALPGALLGSSLGIALKIDDGAKRAAEVAMAALLARFLPGKSVNGSLAALLAELVNVPVTDTRGEPVGAIRPAAEWLTAGWPG